MISNSLQHHHQGAWKRGGLIDRHVSRRFTSHGRKSGGCGGSGGGVAGADSERRRFAPVAAAAAAAFDVGRAEAAAQGLPIAEVIGDVVRSLDASNCAVLQAPPGAGKTTTVPLALLAHGPEYLAGPNGRILVVEPRRVAAKAAARRMASLIGERVGGTVGFRVRLERRVGAATRVEVVTEGILLRRLQGGGAALDGVGAVIFDEVRGE